MLEKAATFEHGFIIVRTDLLWSIDDTRVEAKLEHAQHSGEDGKD